MAYSVTSDVASEFKKITFDANSSVTSTEVTEFISQIDAWIDGVLTSKYETPVTGTESLKILKMISIGLTVQRLIPILRVKTGVENLDQDTQSVVSRAQDLLKDIKKNDLILTDAVKKTTHEGFKSYTSDNSDTIDFTFKVGTDQW